MALYHNFSPFLGARCLHDPYYLYRKQAFHYVLKKERIRLMTTQRRQLSSFFWPVTQIMSLDSQSQQPWEQKGTLMSRHWMEPLSSRCATSSKKLKPKILLVPSQQPHHCYSSEVEPKMIFMRHEISSCHAPVVSSFFIMFKTLVTSLSICYVHLVKLELITLYCPKISPDFVKLRLILS